MNPLLDEKELKFVNSKKKTRLYIVILAWIFLLPSLIGITAFSLKPIETAEWIFPPIKDMIVRYEKREIELNKIISNPATQIEQKLSWDLKKSYEFVLTTSFMMSACVVYFFFYLMFTAGIYLLFSASVTSKWLRIVEKLR